MEEKRYLDYVLKLIRIENHKIKKLSFDIEKYAVELTEAIENIKRQNKDLSSCDRIVYLGNIRIQEKQQMILETRKKINL